MTLSRFQALIPAMSDTSAKRRRQVQELHRLGASTFVIAEFAGRDPSLIRDDLRVLQQQIRPAV